MVSFVLAMGSITSSLVASLGNLFTAALLLFLLASSFIYDFKILHVVGIWLQVLTRPLHNHPSITWP
jgi:hypothetical protein